MMEVLADQSRDLFFVINLIETNATAKLVLSLHFSSITDYSIWYFWELADLIFSQSFRAASHLLLHL